MIICYWEHEKQLFPRLLVAEQISGLDKLGNVMVITREDGSGTRSTFSQLIDYDEKIKKLVHQI